MLNLEASVDNLFKNKLCMYHRNRRLYKRFALGSLVKEVSHAHKNMHANIFPAWDENEI